jgi:hypothetical protein
MTNALRRVVSICLILLALSAASSSQGLLAPKRVRKGMLHIIVTGGDKAKPVNGADVIVRSSDGEFSENTNTNAQGDANMSNVPFGSIVVQVVALGWKTSGRQYDFKEEKPIQVNLAADKTEKPSEPTPSPR